jgi:hypothetical protein
LQADFCCKFQFSDFFCPFLANLGAQLNIYRYLWAQEGGTDDEAAPLATSENCKVANLLPPAQ